MPKNIADQAKQIIQQVAAQAGRKEERAVETQQMVTFELDKEEYASNIGDLREIIKIRNIVPIPGAPGFIAGILNIRGQIVVVIDLEKRFSLKREHKIAPQHIIVAEVENTVFGVIVDEVTGVLRVPVASIKETPGLITSKIHTDYLKGVVVLEGNENIKTRKNKNAENTENTKTQRQEQETEEQKTESTSRLLLVLDMPRMLSEKELLQFGNGIQKTVQETEEVEETKQ